MKLTLPDDPEEALLQIASYLSTKRIGKDRRVLEDGQVAGYWQTTEWLDGLSELQDAIATRRRVPEPLPHPAEMLKEGRTE